MPRASKPKNPVCVVCRKPVRDDEAVELVAKVRAYTCAKHREPAELTVRVGSAVLRAGVESFMEAKSPGLFAKVGKALRVMRGEE